MTINLDIQTQATPDGGGSLKISSEVPAIIADQMEDARTVLFEWLEERFGLDPHDEAKGAAYLILLAVLTGHFIDEAIGVTAGSWLINFAWEHCMFPVRMELRELQH